MAASLQETLETILVVDDDKAVLKTVVTLLDDAKFRVFSAPNGNDAIKLAKGMEGEIHLLLSAVGLPNMSGPDLGKALKKTRPDIHVMLMSGQENGDLLVLNYGWAYIQKQVVAGKLVQMVTDVLHAPMSLRMLRARPGRPAKSRSPPRKRPASTPPTRLRSAATRRPRSSR